MPIKFASLGENRAIKKIGGRDDTQCFLAKLGFVPGASVKVITKINDNIIVNIKGTRVAISSEMANKIFV
jgi:ferrous iron transport protein A